jgi:hypothetical protein
MTRAERRRALFSSTYHVIDHGMKPARRDGKAVVLRQGTAVVLDPSEVLPHDIVLERQALEVRRDVDKPTRWSRRKRLV